METTTPNNSPMAHMAGLRAGRRDLPCLLLPGDLDEASLLIEMAKDNELHQAYSPLERARNILRLMALRDCSQAEACQLLGIKATEGSKWLRVLKGYPEDLHPLIGEGEGKVPVTTAYHLARLKDEPKIRELTERVKNGLLTRDSAEQIVDRELSKSKNARRVKPVRFSSGGITEVIHGVPFEVLKAFHAKLSEALKRVERDPALTELLPNLLR
jgi:ParB-like chromosome segregation protein Spo0J